METLLHINSHKDAHSPYTQTRVADQTGNFIILNSATYDTDHKFPTGNLEYGHSLKFTGNTQYDFNDYYHSFNFANREFTFEGWIKFEGETDVDKKHIIISKWSNYFEEKYNKIFRLSYIHDGSDPSNSQIKFEYAGAKGYPNESYPVVTLRGYDSDYDGEYTLTTDADVPSAYENCHMWVGDNGLLLMPYYEDPEGYNRPNPTNFEAAGVYGNYITNSSYLRDWYKSSVEWEVVYDRRDTLKLPTTSEDSYIASELPMDLRAGTYRLTFMYERGETISESFIATRSSETHGFSNAEDAFEYGPAYAQQADARNVEVYYDGILAVGTFLYLDQEFTNLLEFVSTQNSGWIYSASHTYAMKIVHGEITEVSYPEVTQTTKIKILTKNIGSLGEYQSTDVVYECSTGGTNDIIVDVNEFEVDITKTDQYYIVVEANGNDATTNAYLRGLSLRLIDQYEDESGMGKMLFAKSFPVPSVTTSAVPTPSPTTTSSVPYDFDFDSLVDVTAHMEDGNHVTYVCGNLQDNAWHYIHVSSIIIENPFADKSTIAIGVDNQYDRTTDFDTPNTPTIKYVNNTDGSRNRIEYMSSIQPHFQHGDDSNYFKKLSVQPVVIGADGVSDNKLVGNIDTLRVSEYPVYEDEREYSQRDENSAPSCIVVASGIDNVSKYDENTKYEIIENPPVVDIQIFEPTHADVEVPTNSLELYKKHLGSMEHLKLIWSKTSPPTMTDLYNWRWELKFMRTPWYLTRTPEEVKTWEQYTELKLPLVQEERPSE